MQTIQSSLILLGSWTPVFSGTIRGWGGAAVTGTCLYLRIDRIYKEMALVRHHFNKNTRVPVGIFARG